MTSKGFLQAVANGRSVRSAVFAVLFALLSLQVAAGDHWHPVEAGVDCEVCVHGHGAPLPSSSWPAPLPQSQTYVIARRPVDLPWVARALPTIRGPPSYS